MPSLLFLAPVVSFFGIFSLAGQPHVEQGGEDEGERGDEHRRDQLETIVILSNEIQFRNTVKKYSWEI